MPAFKHRIGFTSDVLYQFNNESDQIMPTHGDLRAAQVQCSQCGPNKQERQACAPTKRGHTESLRRPYLR